jgi:membrane dipeptidase
MRRRLIFDGHLDLAMNAVFNARPQTEPVADVRRREAGVRQGLTPAVSLPDMRRGGVGLCAASIIVRVRPQAPIDRADITCRSPELAYALAQAQLAYYRVLEQQGEVVILTTRGQLDAQVDRWTTPQIKPAAAQPIGLILMMEGADPIIEPAQLDAWIAQGLRCLSLVHMGYGPYAAGCPNVDVDTGLTDLGRILLEQMADRSIALDLTHTSPRSFDEALDRFAGRVCATHSNCRALADNARQFTDSQLRAIVERDGVIGAVCCNGMIRHSAEGAPPREQVGLEHLAQHIDHICQLAGDAAHAAIGSDLDGGFGIEESPREIDTIADLSRLGGFLSDRGYSDADIDAIHSGNWLRFWRQVLPPQ